MLLLDTKNGALHRLLLLPDAQDSPKKTSWWNSKEEMVRNSTCLYYTKGFFFLNQSSILEKLPQDHLSFWFYGPKTLLFILMFKCLTHKIALL